MLIIYHGFLLVQSHYGNKGNEKISRVCLEVRIKKRWNPIHFISFQWNFFFSSFSCITLLHYRIPPLSNISRLAIKERSNKHDTLFEMPLFHQNCRALREIANMSQLQYLIIFFLSPSASQQLRDITWEHSQVLVDVVFSSWIATSFRSGKSI